MPRVAPKIVGVIAIAFGLVTLLAGGNALFGDRSSESGPVVPFVLWFNFLAGIAYVAAGVGVALQRRWGAHVSVVLAVATLLVFAAFGVHVAMGGAYATRTVGAMTFRAAFWVGVAFYARGVEARRRLASGRMAEER